MAKYFTINQFFEALAEEGAYEAYSNSSEKIMLKPEVAIAAIKSGLGYMQLHVELYGNKDVMRVAVEKYGGIAFIHAAEKLKKDKEFVLSLGKIDPEVFFHAEVDDDKEFVLSVIDVAGKEGIEKLFWAGIPDKYAKDPQIKAALKKAERQEKANESKGISTNQIGKATIGSPTVDKRDASEVETEGNKDYLIGREGEF